MVNQYAVHTTNYVFNVSRIRSVGSRGLIIACNGVSFGDTIPTLSRMSKSLGLGMEGGSVHEKECNKLANMSLRFARAA